MPTITTKFGTIEALPGAEFYPDGSVRTCIAERACRLDTPAGILVPQFNSNTLRKRQLPVISFHPNGMIRNLPLEEQTTIPTPSGDLSAEQVTFYEDGAVKRVFPLNGNLNGYWSQEDEAGLAAPIALDTPIGPVETKILSLYFGPQGNLRSLTLWPDARLEVPSPLGNITTRIGLSFFDSGAISSLEPAGPTSVRTPLGCLFAYDPDAVGICGDQNSLRFRDNGALMALKTTAHAFDVVLENGRVKRVSPPLRPHPCDGERMEAGPLSLEFSSGRVTFLIPEKLRLSSDVAGITVAPFHVPLPSLSPMCSMGAGKW